MIEIRKDIIVVSNSIKGIQRVENQDYTFFIEEKEYYLFFLFDGVSSLTHSIDYIHICKQFIKDNYTNYFSNDVRLAELMYETHKFSINQNVYGLSTCSAIYLSKVKKEDYLFNIGDSRIYEYSNQYLDQITIDDALSGNENILTKCLGSYEVTELDFVQDCISFKNGILLCSDGFYKLMEQKLKKYFSIFQYKRGINVFKALERLQMNYNNDDSTYILIRRNGF